MSQQLEDYNYQLSQVNTALEKDSENEELLQLKKDLEQLLELLQEESQLLEAAATETASAPVKKDSAQKSIDLELLEGDMVLGKWSDGQYYECMVCFAKVYMIESYTIFAQDISRLTLA